MEKIPAQMTVVAISKPGGPEVLVPETRAVPAPMRAPSLRTCGNVAFAVNALSKSGPPMPTA